MWSTLSSNPNERIAFFNLLDEYFDQSNSTSTSTFSKPKPTTTQRTPSTLTPTPPTPSFSSRANDLSTTASNSLATSLLKNPTLSSQVFKSSGLSESQAGAASKFGAQHSEVLAPHLASAGRGAITSTWNNKESLMGSQKPIKGAKPTGLTTINKGVTRTVLGIRGPMSKQDAKNNVFQEPLATRANPRMYTPPASIHSPPPMRTSHQDEGLGKAIALYDYAGTESDDLPLREGDEVTVIAHVSSDWWKCRDSQGQEGLVPTSYVKQV